jgi:epoxyqueuosine reductase
MQWLARPDAVERRLDPHRMWPQLRSAILVAHNYLPSGARDAANPQRGIIARYAHGRDYHRVIRKKLIRLRGWLEQQLGEPLPLTRTYVDTGPVLEREVARRAGLGWFAKNTMLIHPRRGSYFFLGCLLVEIELEYDEPFDSEHCGQCTACLEACPTGALLGRDANGAPVIDARRCISYLTIEHRGPIPIELRPLMGNRIFGCDICQEVCPWNGPKFVTLTRERAYAAEAKTQGGVPGKDAPELVELMRMGEEEWDSFSRGSPVRRAGRAGFLRNVAIALGNWGSADAVPALAGALGDREPLVRGHAAWALGRIHTERARTILLEQLERETHEEVRAEIRLALENVGSGAVQAGAYAKGARSIP